MSMQKLFSYSLWVLFVAGLLVLATFFPGMAPAWESRRLHPLLNLFGGALGIFVALAASFLWIGMLIDCIIARNVNVAAKLLWIVALLIVNIAAALVYYFSTYTRQNRFCHV
jgi:hypothetical protein